MSSRPVPELRIPGIHYSRDSGCWDLACLLYYGGAETDIRYVRKLIDNGNLGLPVAERLQLVERIYDVICGMQAAGKSRLTIWSYFAKVRSFYAWSERQKKTLTMDSAREVFLGWAAHLTDRVENVRDLNTITAYGYLTIICKILNDVLELRGGLMLEANFLKKRKKYEPPNVTLGQLSNSSSAELGNMLLDICDALSKDVILGKLPVAINLRTGQKLVEWSNLRPADTLKTLGETVHRSARLATLLTRERYEADASIRTRYPLFNLRIEAELLIFIAQTGMNLSQAHKLKMGKFSFSSHINGYEVKRVFKARRQGPVAFSIFSEYRPIFERYLAWRNSIFGTDEDSLLFPHSTPQNKRSPDVAPTFRALRSRCDQLGIEFIGPRSLRSIRVNWLQKYLKDEDITAELSQHSVNTLLRSYVRPTFGEAAIEISKFHAQNELAFRTPAPGVCAILSPEIEQGAPQGSPEPDCASPAGCLFCRSHRDLDHADHVWSLTSYRHLKMIERSQYVEPERSQGEMPCDLVIDRLSAKLTAFQQIDEVRESWVREANTRIAEEYYHPMWDGFIRIMER